VLQEFYPGRELKDEEQSFMACLKGCIWKLRNREPWGMLSGIWKEHGCSPNAGKHSLNENTDGNGWKRVDCKG